MSTERKYVVGLTGGIGSGKTTVAKGFAARGAHVIDADALAHELSGPGGAAIDALRETFGAAFITPSGALDRVAMRRLAFEDDAARARLEGILHPMIRTATERAIQAAHAPYTLLVIPLLFESKDWRERVARAAVVDCSEAEQIERVMRRSNLLRADVEAIMARQIGRAARLALADDIIDNSGKAEALDAVIDTLHADYLARAHAMRL